MKVIREREGEGGRREGGEEGGREGKGGKEVREEGGRAGGREGQRKEGSRRGEEGGFGLGRWITIQKRPRQFLLNAKLARAFPSV